jgi:hypothetical protein
MNMLTLPVLRTMYLHEDKGENINLGGLDSCLFKYI